MNYIKIPYTEVFWGNVVSSCNSKIKFGRIEKFHCYSVNVHI